MDSVGVAPASRKLPSQLNTPALLTLVLEREIAYLDERVIESIADITWKVNFSTVMHLRTPATVKLTGFEKN